MKWIKELDEETSALKGQPIYMTCELNKERDVVWKKNGEVLKKKAGKVQINIIGMQHAVTIQNSADEDPGSYSCEVSGQEDVKTTTNVKVIGKQWKILYMSLNTVIHINTSAFYRYIQYTSGLGQKLCLYCYYLQFACYITSDLFVP